METKIIRFKDLSLPLKIAIGFSLASLGYTVIMFGVGFLVGLISTL